MKKGEKRIILYISLFFVSMVLLGGAILLVYSTTVKLDLDKFEVRNNSLEVYDIDNNLTLTDNKYTYLEDIPINLQNAFIAMEDKRFYSHNGLDLYRIGGALIHDIKVGSFEQGASTITCQLVKNTHLSNDKTLKRKLDEAILAVKLENKLSKNQILQSYLNVIYFGNGIYGVGNASLRFFDKELDQLTLPECVSIAAVVANPAKFSPITNPQNNNDRKNIILQAMLDQSLIDKSAYLEAVNVFVKANEQKDNRNSDYIELVIEEASKILGVSKSEIIQNNYKIYTYLDCEEQEKLVEQIKNATDSTSIVIADNKASSISAYVSNHRYSPFTMQRNAGSIIKPFIYASGFENDIMCPITYIDDSPTEFGNYTPKNYGNRYRGLITVRKALSVSSNICAVKTLESVGFSKAFATLNKFGFSTSEKDKNYTLALGSLNSGVTIVGITSAYSALANGGRYMPLSTIRMIEDNNGKTLYIRDESTIIACSARTADMINDCLKECVNNGTLKKLSSYNGLCGKTGTFEVNGKNSDCWLTLYDDNKTYCVWQGNLSMKKEDMLTKTGSSGVDLIIESIPKLSDYPHNVTKKQAIDALILQRYGQIQLASYNTPERYIIYDYAPTNAKISTLFTAPTADVKVVCTDGIIDITIKANAECYYLIYQKCMGFTIPLNRIENSSDEITVRTLLAPDKNEIMVETYVKGKNISQGETVTEYLYG